MFAFWGAEWLRWLNIKFTSIHKIGDSVWGEIATVESDVYHLPLPLKQKQKKSWP